MAISSAYSMSNVAATIDGREVIGFWDGDDAVTVAQGADKGTGVIGADGSGIFSISANKSATITFRLMHTSPTHRLLMQKLRRQQALGAGITAFPVTVIDTASNEGGAAQKCYIMTAPSDSKGTNATVREWVLWTVEWTPEIPNGN